LTRIALTGKMGSGKSTASHFLEDYGFKCFSFASKLKELATDLFKMEGKDRELLQRFGSAMREIDRDVWARYLVENIEANCPIETCRAVVDDLRYLNEAELLKKHGFVLVRLICLDDENRIRWLKDKGTLVGENHPSETEQDSIEVDFEIRWRDLTDLKNQIITLAKLTLGGPSHD